MTIAVEAGVDAALRISSAAMGLKSTALRISAVAMEFVHGDGRHWVMAAIADRECRAKTSHG